jgi:hypothetical protein
MSIARVPGSVKAAAGCLLGSALSLVACGLDPEGGLLSAEAKQIVHDQEDSEEVLSVGTAVAAAPTYVLSAQTVTLASAVAAQEALSSLAEPAGCLTVETSGNRVTYTLDGCTGPWGRHEVSGKQIATFSPGPDAGAFVIDITTEGLTIDSAPASYAATGTITIEGEARTLEWSGSFSGQAADGRDVVHDTSLLLTSPGDGTLSVSGSSSTRIGLRGIEVEIDDLTRNGPIGTCPEGTITVRRKVGGLTVTLTFDGTREFVAKTSRGGRGMFESTCVPEGG